MIKTLNNIRIATLDDNNAATLKSKFFDLSIADLQNDAINIFAKNAPEDTYNLPKLEALDTPFLNMPIIGPIPKNVSSQKIEEILNCNQCNTDGLAQLLHIKV